MQLSFTFVVDMCCFSFFNLCMFSLFLKKSLMQTYLTIDRIHVQFLTPAVWIANNVDPLYEDLISQNETLAGWLLCYYSSISKLATHFPTSGSTYRSYLQFSLKYQGETVYFLRIKVTHLTHHSLHQSKYIRDRLHRAKMLSADSVLNPMVSALWLCFKEG